MAQKREIKSFTIYSRNLLTRSILLPITAEKTYVKPLREILQFNLKVSVWWKDLLNRAHRKLLLIQVD